MNALVQETLYKAAGHLPGNLRSLARRIYYRDPHWAHSALKQFGTVQDLYFWIADGNLDTLLLLQNYFSAFFPLLNTGTEGTITLYSEDGIFLGSKSFQLVHSGGAKFRVSALLPEYQVAPDVAIGTLEVNIRIPEAVLEYIREQKSFYFHDRFHISYVSSQGQPCFVHGVDKAHIYREGEADPVRWYKVTDQREWAPEIPVNIGEYKKFNVIMINRGPRKAEVKLTLSDSEDRSVSWQQEIPSKGVRRFQLTEEDTTGLASTELRMRVSGMATQFGRPVVLKEFPNGAISAMHC